MVVLDQTFEYASSRLKKLRNALWLKRLPQSCQRLRQVHRIASSFCKQRMRIAQRTVYLPAHIEQFRCCKLVLVKNFGENPSANEQQADFFCCRGSNYGCKSLQSMLYCSCQIHKSIRHGQEVAGALFVANFLNHDYSIQQTF